MARDSLRIETDVVDFSGGAGASWWFLAQQLKHDLTSIILMSEEDLQVHEKKKTRNFTGLVAFYVGRTTGHLDMFKSIYSISSLIVDVSGCSTPAASLCNGLPGEESTGSSGNTAAGFGPA